MSLLFADPKVGKSILSVQLAHALGTGSSLLGKKVSRKWRVLYVQADEPEHEWIKQLRMLGLNDEWSTVWLPKWPPPMMHPMTYTELKKIVKDFEFVIVDSIFSLFGFPEITSPGQAGLIIRKLEELHQGPLWVIHHKRKSSPGVPDQSTNSAAGSFALTGAASTLYDLGKSRLQARGRVVAADMPLRRSQNGLWLVDHEAQELGF